MQQILRRTAHDPVRQRFLLGGKSWKAATGLFKVEGRQFDLRRAAAVKDDELESTGETVFSHTERQARTAEAVRT
ncbi:MAG: hypothetical protein IJT44_09475 [Clostridia bacterium]|nr:hypothetical protein [Clostridia bacterium]